jgi:ubiquinol-cytochrome c reductase cytochrome b subunit
VKRMARRWSQLEKRAYAAAKKVFPSHWSFLLGEIAMFSFFVLVGTGLYLTFFYQADAASVRYDGAYAPLHGVDVSVAFHSVLDITFERPFGRVIRQTHHWAALVFIAAVVIHAARVFFTGAFRRPRRFNWTVGVTLMGLSMVTGFFGFVLPHDLLGGTSARIGHAFAVSIPWIGPGVAEMLYGGPFGNPDMLRRLWQLHVLVLPDHDRNPASRAPGAGVAADPHPVPGRQRKRRGRHRCHRPPRLFAQDRRTGSAGGGSSPCGRFAHRDRPLWINGPFDPTAATVPAQPDWYLAWVEGALRILPAAISPCGDGRSPVPSLVGVAFPVALFAILYAWPFLEERAVGDRGGHHCSTGPRSDRCEPPSVSPSWRF